MKLENLLPTLIDWKNIPSEQVQGRTGFTISKVQLIGATKIRLVEYSANYTADHWCDKGHILFVVEGELEIHYKDDSSHVVKKGMTYLVGDNSKSHMAISKDGAKVLIVD
jgi:mannose-6-phosphate isomerase class I